MARHLRRFDPHGHLITTSDDDLNHPLWQAMDYLQPHLYTSNMILGVQSLAQPPAVLDRPVFYGEVGDDNMVGLTPEQQADGAGQVPTHLGRTLGATHSTRAVVEYRCATPVRPMERVGFVGKKFAASNLFTSIFEYSTSPSVVGGDTVLGRLNPDTVGRRGKSRHHPSSGTSTIDRAHGLSSRADQCLRPALFAVPPSGEI